MSTFLDRAAFAAFFNISERTTYVWHDRGYIEGYDDNGTLKFNLEAAELAMKLNPRAMRDGRKRGRNGVVKPMPIQAVSE